MTDITFITCAEYPHLDPDDVLLANALQKRGLTVSTAVWSNVEVDWSASKWCLIRSTWDYDRRSVQFLDWVRNVSKVSVLHNDPVLLEWNMDKRYLRELSNKGIQVVPTVWLAPEEVMTVEALIENLGETVVIKPTVGLGGRGVARLHLGEQRQSQVESNIRNLQASGTAMVQPFVEGVLGEGEHSLMFFCGAFSHAIRKSPFAAMAFAGCAGESKIEATDEEVQFGLDVLSVLSKKPLYARVDLVRFRERLHLMELELIEPSLYFSYSNNAEEDLATLIASKLV